MIELLIDIVIVFLIAVGAIFTFVGSFGLLKLNNCMSRLHAPTKASTLGIGSLLMASIIYSLSHGEGSMHQVLVMAFLFATAPVTGNLISKTNLHTRRDHKDVPAPPKDKAWAVEVAEKHV